jgi:hypothetical protein
MINDCGAVGGMITGRRNRKIRSRPKPGPLYSQKHVILSEIEHGPPQWEAGRLLGQQEYILNEQFRLKPHKRLPLP